MRKDKIYDLLRKLTDINSSRYDLICTEILSLYKNFHQELDENWTTEFLIHDKTRNRLLELVILKKFNNIENLEIRKYQGDTPKKPDFQLRYKDTVFAFEATSVGIPTSDESILNKICEKEKPSKIGEQLKQVSFDVFELHEEFKSRLTQAIQEKSNKYKNELPKETGFILFVSLGEISCQKPGFDVLVQALYGYGKYIYSINEQKKVTNMSFEFQHSFKKNNTFPESKISNKYFLDQDTQWISAIVLSEKDPFYLLGWNLDEKDDFVVVHNPYANIPLKKELLPAMTECFFEPVIGYIGHNIFPDY